MSQNSARSWAFRVIAFGMRLGAGHFPRLAFLAAMLTCASTLAQAEPFVPATDATVLEHLPDAGDSRARALRAQHRALAADPHNLKLALAVARGDLDRSRALGDPRFLGRAEAALAPWLNDAGQPDVMLLRAVILQSNHDFNGALAILAQVLRARPGDAQAWLTRAAIHQAQANYPAAIADCGQFANLILGLAPDICTASAMSLTGHAPLALRAVALSLQTNAAEAAREPGVAMWGLTLAAETAARLDDPQAETWFGRAMALDAHDPYLLAAWSDWLLAHGRAAEVVGLLADTTRIDPLLLRLALAEQATNDPKLAAHIANLAARFEASRLRGDTVHRREEAMFELALRHDPATALALALANWNVQREPADAKILLQAALTTGNAEAAAPAIAWLNANHVEDGELSRLAARLPAAPPKS
jgi:tetratricopeptide (TPR) repeat protein